METLCCQTRFVQQKGCLVWIIKGFTTQCPSQNGEFLLSHKFHITGCKKDWHLKLYPRGVKDEPGFVSLYLHKTGEGIDYITCEFSLIDRSGEKVNQKIDSLMHESNFGCKDFISLDLLLKKRNQLLPKDELTVSCILTMTKAVDTSGKNEIALCRIHPNRLGVECRSTLSNDMVKMLDEDKNTDFVLKADGYKIHCHKLVLASRSPVFARMLQHNMQESISNEVVIKDVEKHVLNAFVRFMYTDEISFHDVNFALKIMVIADKYDLPLLRSRCLLYLHANLSTYNVMDILMTADDLNEIKLIRRCVRMIECEIYPAISLSDWITRMAAYPKVWSILQRFPKSDSSESNKRQKTT